MISRRVRGVMAGFLGTYTSRYADHGGYWLFGFLVEAPPFEIDLLSGDGADASPRGTASRLARLRFGEQLHKRRLDPASIGRAILAIEPTDRPAPLLAGVRPGARGVRVTVTVTLPSTRRVVRETMVFAAPHDPSLESRSVRSS